VLALGPNQLGSGGGGVKACVLPCGSFAGSTQATYTDRSVAWLGDSSLNVITATWAKRLAEAIGNIEAEVRRFSEEA
jgi:hypothetical protein